MGKIAIDVVLVPPKSILDFAIKKNRELLTGVDDITILDEKTCVPHLSLYMGAIEEEKLDEISDVLRNLTEKISPLDLIGINIKNHLLSNGKMAAGLKIKNTPPLQQLHESIMRALWPYLSYDLDKAMYFSPSKIDPITLELTKHYQQKKDDSTLFHPHVTLGIGKLKEEVVQIPFQASELALFQLGNYCTCTKKLYSTHL